LTLRELAALMHYSHGYLSKIENGQTLPSADFLRRWDAVLSPDGQLIRRAAGGSDERQAGGSADPTGTAAAPAYPTTDQAGPREPSASTEPTDVADSNVEHSLSTFRRILENIRDLGQTLGPSAIGPMLIPYVVALEDLARRVDLCSKAEVQLLAARFAEYAGWMSQELGDDNGALRWTDRAVALAREAGDADLLAYAYVRRANIALYQNDSFGTVTNARQAQGMDCSARVRGLAAQREAQGHALAGDYQAFRQCLERSMDLLASHEMDIGRERPSLGPTRIRDSVALSEGWGLHDLRRGEEAVAVLTRALDQTPQRARRARARIAARLARALASIEEIDRACATIQPILVDFPIMESATIRSDLRQLAHELNRWPTNPSVRRILPELSEALTPTSLHPWSSPADALKSPPYA